MQVPLFSHFFHISDSKLGEPFPTDLNTPGLMDDHGFLYYREPVIVDLSVTDNKIQVFEEFFYPNEAAKRYLVYGSRRQLL